MWTASVLRTWGIRLSVDDGFFLYPLMAGFIDDKSGYPIAIIPPPMNFLAAFEGFIVYKSTPWIIPPL
jgi:hypothetical protein